MDLNIPTTVGELAARLGVAFAGDGLQIVSGLNEIHRVRAGDVTFVDVEKYYNKVLSSAATTIIINKEIEAPAGKSLLYSDNPFATYQTIIDWYWQAEAPATPASHQPSQTIYPNVYIGNHVTLGENVTIYPNVSIYDHVTIGNNVIIHANTVIGSHAFYYKKTGPEYLKMISCGGVIIEDDVEIGANCTIDKGVSDYTRIGKGTKIDNLVQIGHEVVIGQNCIIGAQCGIAGTAIIEDNVIVWGQAGVTKDVVIGKGAVVAAQAGVSKSLEGGKVYTGSPAAELMTVRREQAWLRNEAGKKRRE